MGKGGEVGMPKLRIDMAEADMDTGNAALEKDMAKAREDITMAEMDPLQLWRGQV
jgi:hypothetical protein